MWEDENLGKTKDLITKLNITNSLKYKALIIFCILVHTCIAVFSYVYDITPLLIFNLCSIFIYIISGFMIKKHPAVSCYIGFIEIICHSFVTVILLGNNFGFSMYFILLVPMIYSMLHSINTKHYIIKSNILAVLSFVLYVTCYIISYINPPVYETEALNQVRPYVYIINMFVTFVALSSFSILFILETVAAYNKLYTKNKELDNLANTDHLTGLYNRRTMTEHVMTMLSDYKITNQPFSVIVCDIDDFKILNDTYGHKCGDEVLKTISTTLSNLIRDKDFLCRWGGEEFLVLLRNTDVELARTIAERIREKIASINVIYNSQPVSVTMTFGVASVSEEQNYDSLFKLADGRLYEGKNSGKNVVV